MKRYEAIILWMSWLIAVLLVGLTILLREPLSNLID